jgi:hypothetical protein
LDAAPATLGLVYTAASKRFNPKFGGRPPMAAGHPGQQGFHSPLTKFKSLESLWKMRRLSLIRHLFRCRNETKENSKPICRMTLSLQDFVSLVVKYMIYKLFLRPLPQRGEAARQNRVSMALSGLG